ncbi:MAG TPA: DUF4394 domain-containing protein [Tepidisphaeraceae bacterium]|nr:DUF4394 domain-containing protein [Tepidisphaeraceae bacterium]
MTHPRPRRLPSIRSCALEPLEQRRLLSAAIALGADNRLLTFDTDAPGTITRQTPVLGLMGAGESLLAIDFRPATGELYGLDDGSRLYKINLSTGVATQIGPDFVTPLQDFNTFEFDFDPAVDRIRAVSLPGQNLRLHPDTGAAAPHSLLLDANLAFASGDVNAGGVPIVVAAAYDTNVFAGAATTLYAIDSHADALLRIGSDGGSPVSPITGQTFTVGALGVNVVKRAGMDIVTTGTTNTAFAVLQVDGQVAPSLYTINLDTGAATSAGSFGERRIFDIAIVPPRTVAFALSSNNELLAFNAHDPTNIFRKTRIKGLADGENILGIDFRPATGELIAVSSEDKMYVVNPKVGVTTQIGTGTFEIPATGMAFGFDFNPAADRIRLVSDATQNLRLNPITGGVVDSNANAGGMQADGDLFFDGADPNAGEDPNVVASAYTDNDNDAATPTTLYGIDTSLNALVRQGSITGTPFSPNDGLLFTVGALGVGARDAAALDILTRNGIDEAYAAIQLEGASARPGMYRVNLATGIATRLGSIGGNRTIIGLTVAPA